MKTFKSNIFSFIAALLLIIGAAGCSSDLFEAPEGDGGNYEDGTQLVLTVALPQATRAAGDADGRAEASELECKINSLRMIAFAPDGKVENRVLAATPGAISDKSSQTFTMKGMRPGDYYIYVMANIPEGLVSDIRSEAQLKKVLLDYTSGLPEAGNLPMIYEPSAGTPIPAEGTPNPTVHELSMKFACVKVRYNIIFDKSLPDVAAVFGENGLKIKDASFAQVSSASALVTDESRLFDIRSASASGSYYNGYDEDRASSASSVKDVVTPQGTAVATPADPTRKWLWQGTVYLPERYAKDASEQTRLDLNAYVCGKDGKEGSVRNRYSILLGGYDGAPGAKVLPRDTYYEVIAKVKSLGSAELDANIVIKDWMAQNLSSDFIHTYLKLSKTTLDVTSLENDSLTYQTDGRGALEYGCDKELKGFKVVLFSEDSHSGKISVRVNHDINILSLTPEERVGTARCFVKAGNIKKYFSVNYDIHPFFEVTPHAVKIQYDNAGELRTKVFEYRTNLGGILLTEDGNISNVYIGNGKKSYTLDTNGKRVSVTCEDPSKSTGKITVTALNNPETTLFYYLDAYPSQYNNLTADLKNGMENGGMEDLDITVMPPLGGYRIYFRAINDYHVYNGGSGTSEFNDPLPEGGSNNWIDYWNNSGSIPADDGGNGKRDTHRIYVYTQYGETHGTSITGPVWKFTYSFGDKRDNSDNRFGGVDSRMIPDNNNPGWYYYNLPADKTPVSTENLDRATQQQKDYYNIPRPGETLMIFYNGWYVEQGYNLHRAPHHLDPGILLFDYEDREGWVIYDPTSVPYYNKFDEKPVIENTVFTIYSDKKVNGWYLMYGNASNAVPSDAQRYTIWRNNVNCKWTSSPKGCYKTEIVLKCPKGEYSKGIVIKFDGGSASEIFNGRAYPNNTGYFNTSTKKWSTSLNF